MKHPSGKTCVPECASTVLRSLASCVILPKYEKSGRIAIGTGRFPRWSPIGTVSTLAAVACSQDKGDNDLSRVGVVSYVAHGRPMFTWGITCSG